MKLMSCLFFFFPFAVFSQQANNLAAVTDKYNRFEFVLAGVINKYTGAGQRAVLYLHKSHAIVLERNIGFQLNPIYQILPFMGLELGFQENISGTAQNLAYRLLLDEKNYFQLGYQEQLISYEYLDCSKSCASPIVYTKWKGKIKSAIFSIGRQMKNANSRLFVGGELGVSYNLGNTLEEEVYQGHAGFKDAAYTKLETSKKAILQNKMDTWGIIYIGIGF